ncbi:hypothetical protein H5410_002301 [Solanum commersonii]|uniref:Uncharacterized protein n=1 Tax=Solanum commersonii TaxID=4109 RepID=A0A9J6B1M9_SOLCO|nr:hypothetical protein H5410_002301 [Solanum commersonii]
MPDVKIFNLDFSGGSYIGSSCAGIMATTTTERPPFEDVLPTPQPQTTTYTTLFNFNTLNPK